MRRRTFLQLAAAAPVFGQTTKTQPAPGTGTKAPPKAPAAAKVPAGTPWTPMGRPASQFPDRSAAGLKDQWPKGGPKVVWKRPLSDGYSPRRRWKATSFTTMYGRGNEEVLLACDASTGKTLWEHAEPRTFTSDAASDQGNGPYSTPLIVGEPGVLQRNRRPPAGRRQGSPFQEGPVDAATLGGLQGHAGDVWLCRQPLSLRRAR